MSKFKKYKIVNSGLVLLIMLLFFPQDGHSEISALNLLQIRLVNTKALGGSFHQEYFDSLQGKKSFSSGTFAFLQPALMKWHYTKPDELEIVIGKKKLWIFDPVLENVTIKKVDAITDYQTLASLFKPDQLQKFFMEIQPAKKLLTDDPTAISIYLAPKKQIPGTVEIQVSFDKNRHYIKQFVIIDANQNYRKISFSNINLNPDFHESQFVFTIVDGTEVLEED